MMTATATRVLKRKSKMVSFRVSSEDYDKLRMFCVSKGQRSVSDLARLAVSTILENGGAPTTESRLAELETRTHFLMREVLRLAGHQPAMPNQAEFYAS